MKPLGVQESEARVLEVVKVVLVEVSVVVFQYSANLPLRYSPGWIRGRSSTDVGLISSSSRLGSARALLFLFPAGQTTGVVFDTKHTVVVDRVVVVDVVEI